LIDYKIYSTVKNLPVSWDGLSTKDIFLKTNFLGGLEESAPKNISSYYIGVFKSNELVGEAIIQRVEMYADDIFRKSSNNKLKQLAKQLVSKIVKGNALVIGNLMHTGQHGFYFELEKLSQDEFLNTLEKAIQELTLQIRTRFKKKIRIVAFKDYFVDDNIHKSYQFFKDNGLYKAQVQPNMLLSINKEWKRPEDYIMAFNKKYKRRYKTARKKFANLERRELDAEYIETHSKGIFELYETVSDNAKVNSFKLQKHHFRCLKSQLKEDFRVFGYFLNEQLVGFYTLILNNDILETYFLGYNKELQSQHQMYLNMIFDMAFFGIENKFESIVFARTAMEIKSSIGAKPKTMHVYLKHTNNFIANTILRCIVKYMNPIQKWEERHPFS
jgi:hypothetical protein